MNIQNNPWSFLPGDIVTSAITSVTLNADGTVTLVSTSNLTFNTGSGGNPAVWLTLFGVTNAAYNGFYLKLIGATGQTNFTLVPQFSIPAGTAASASGTVAQCLYPWKVRVEDMSWQKPTAAAQNLDFRDRAGNVTWQATSAGIGSQNRGKVFWIEGITPVTLDSGIVIVTVN